MFSYEVKASEEIPQTQTNLFGIFPVTDLTKIQSQIHNYNFIQYYTQLQIVLRKHVIPSSFVINTF